MELFTMPRAGGKTTAMLGWLSIDVEHRVVVVASIVEARSLRDRLVDEYGVVYAAANKAVIHPGEINSIRGREVELAVDDVDRVLTALLGAPVVLGTVTW